MTRTRIRLCAVLAAGGLAVALGGGEPVEAATSPALAAAKSCRKQLTNQGRTYYKKRVQNLLNCVDRLLKCEVILEVDGSAAIDEGKCRSSAQDACRKRIGPASDTALKKAAASFDAKAGQACLAHDVGPMLATGAGGLWFGNDAPCAGSADVATLVTCVRGRIEEQADAVVAGTKPRAALLLKNAGFTNYPNIPPPPIDAHVISATGAGSGVLVSPGTINLPAGTALQFSGDSATLPCGGGMGMNGKLTVRVVGGAPEQEFQIKEPYGPSRLAIFGPYTALGTISFEAELKDSGCNQPAIAFDVNVVP